MIQAPSLAIFTIELITSATPTSLTIPELEDSGTQSFQLFAGFESETCGSWTSIMTSSQTWILQDLSDDLTFSIEVDEDESLIGDHTLSVEVSSDDYPSYIIPYTISVLISVV